LRREHKSPEEESSAEIHEGNVRLIHNRSQKGEILKQFFTASDEQIAAGETTDTYFTRTRKILEENGLTGLKVSAEVTAGEFPAGWSWAVFAGLEEVIRLFEGMPVDVYSMPEGTIFRNRSRNGITVPLMYVEGSYYDFAVYETPLLGFICHSSGIATATARYRKMCRDRMLLAFGIRRAHPAIAPMIDRASYIGGCDSVSSIIGANAIGQEPQGTMPHAGVLVFGDASKAFTAYSKSVPSGGRKIALVDTFSDEKQEALTAARTISDLYGVRLDTPRSRRGSLPSIVSEVRWELDASGFRNVKIFVSGGIREEDIEALIQAGVDGFGVGTAISNASVVDFSMDIVSVNGKGTAKRGKFSGRKDVYGCPKCLQFDVVPVGNSVLKCPVCGVAQRKMLKKVLSKGKRSSPAAGVKSIRAHVLEQLSLIGEL
jgi:nicotinate phosphoribosyltransferase